MDSRQGTESFIHQAVEWAALGFGLLAIAVLVAAVAFIAVKRGTLRFLFRLDRVGAFESYRHQLARPLLLALELLIAAGIARTVIVEQAMHQIAVLGLLVVVRTLLSWSTSVEMERRWPWQGRSALPGHDFHRVAAP